MEDEYIEADFCWNCCRLIKKEDLIQPSFCSEECKNALAEENRKEAEAFEKEQKENEKIINEAKRFLTKEQIDVLNEELEGLDYICNCEIIDKPKGEKQTNSSYDEEWVDQRSVGISGDSWIGEVYIKLSNGKYLTYHYDC